MCDKTIKCKIDVVKTKLLQSVFGFFFFFCSAIFHSNKTRNGGLEKGISWQRFYYPRVQTKLLLQFVGVFLQPYTAISLRPHITCHNSASIFGVYISNIP